MHVKSRRKNFSVEKAAVRATTTKTAAATITTEASIAVATRKIA